MSIDVVVKERDQTLSLNGERFDLDRSFVSAEIGNNQTEVSLKYKLNQADLEKSNELPVVLDSERIYNFLESKGLEGQIEVSPSRITNGSQRGDYLTLYGDCMTARVCSN